MDHEHHKLASVSQPEGPTIFSQLNVNLEDVESRLSALTKRIEDLDLLIFAAIPPTPTTNAVDEAMPAGRYYETRHTCVSVMCATATLEHALNAFEDRLRGIE